MQLPKLKKNSINPDMLKAVEIVLGIIVITAPRFWPSLFPGTMDITGGILITAGGISKHDNGDLQIFTWRLPILKIKQIYAAIPTVHSVPPPAQVTEVTAIAVTQIAPDAHVDASKAEG